MPAPSKGRVTLVRQYSQPLRPIDPKGNRKIKEDRTDIAVDRLVRSIPRENLDLQALIKKPDLQYTHPGYDSFYWRPRIRSMAELRAQLEQRAGMLRNMQALNNLRMHGEAPDLNAGSTGLQFNPHATLDTSQIQDWRGGQPINPGRAWRPHLPDIPGIPFI